MKSLISAGFALAFVTIVAAPADAAKFPPGSYLQSCRNVYLDSSSGKQKLFAECPDRQGIWHHSGMQYMKCSGDIANQNGALICVGQAPSGAQGGNNQNAYNQGGNNQGSNNQGGNNQGGNNQGGNDQGGNNQGGNNQGGDNQGGNNQGGDETGNAGGQPANTQGGQPANNQGGQPANAGGATTANAGPGMPAGNWQRTCRTPHLSESVLTANCQRRDGAYHYSALDLQSCDGGPVGNDNGRLVCETGGQTGGQSGGQAGGDQGGGNAAPGNGAGNANAGGALPAGSWQQSCNNPQLVGSMLTASCQRQDGGFRFSAIDVRSCPSGRVGNFEGSLDCE